MHLVESSLPFAQHLMRCRPCTSGNSPRTIFLPLFPLDSPLASSPDCFAGSPVLLCPCTHVRLSAWLPSFQDADLIMLALATHEVHFSILREVGGQGGTSRGVQAVYYSAHAEL